MFIEAFSTHFGAIEDNRQAAKVTYPLHDLMFVSLCGVIAGAQGWSEIKDYAEGHHEWFKKHGFLMEGIPVDDTIARTLSRVDPEQFQLCFANWMQEVQHSSAGELIAIDGKTLRGSYNRDDRSATIHMVNAFACANKLVLGQVKTDAKSNEITAIPELLDMLDVSGALVSIDAMGCQTEIARTIVAKEGDYLLNLKANQGKLFDAVKEAFKQQRQQPLDNLAIEKNKGRIEGRLCYTQSANGIAQQFPQWPALNTLGLSISFRAVKGKELELRYRYYISSASLDEQQLADSVRHHWQIENSLHWVLDVSMKEDKCQIYQDHGAENLAVLRQLGLNMLRQEASKLSIPKKQKKAWMKTSYLEEVLAAGLSGG